MAKSVIWLCKNLSATKDLMDNTFTDLWSIGIESYVVLTECSKFRNSKSELNSAVRESIKQTLAKRFEKEDVEEVVKRKKLSVSVTYDGRKLFGKEKIYDTTLAMRLRNLCKILNSDYEELYVAIDICSAPMGETIEIMSCLQEILDDRVILYATSTTSAAIADQWIDMYVKNYKKIKAAKNPVIYNRYGVAVTNIKDYKDCLLLSALKDD